MRLRETSRVAFLLSTYYKYLTCSLTFFVHLELTLNRGCVNIKTPSAIYIAITLH